jgi:hypothetical protein
MKLNKITIKIKIICQITNNRLMYNIKSTFNSNNIEGLTNNNYTITFNKINSSRDSPTKTNNSRDSLTKMNINKDKNKKMNNIIFSLIKINRDNKAILRKNSRD